MMRRPSMGRQKIEMKKIEKDDARHVCFSKRRSGLFKKAFELALLCDAHIAIIVLSPAGKLFSFAHPSPDPVLHSFLSSAAAAATSAAPDPELEELKRRHEELLGRVEAAAGAGARFWWDMKVNGLGLEDLEGYRALLEELREKVGRRADELAKAQFSPSAFLDHEQIPPSDSAQQYYQA